MRVIPASSAAWMVAMLSCRSAGPYMPDMPMQPRPIADTTGPWVPSFRFFIVCLSCSGSADDGLRIVVDAQAGDVAQAVLAADRGAQFTIVDHQPLQRNF